MHLRVKYIEGVFKPLQKVKGLKEESELDISLDESELHLIAMKSKSFDFLENEPELYSEFDLVE
ncbi:hypothetical protein COV18_00905 [Candidatus Woesearchaeota archaeon CG10_big_fil_rev_8_21_14_0_10_37_12]|nr:MAG: hypothetical protein COV18_00905 [Candidatus Woesearchaeota archaeon CG10_big_fil_rev_8_21_14_0_10_37_12]